MSNTVLVLSKEQRTIVRTAVLVELGRRFPRTYRGVRNSALDNDLDAGAAIELEADVDDITGLLELLKDIGVAYEYSLDEEALPPSDEEPPRDVARRVVPALIRLASWRLDRDDELRDFWEDVLVLGERTRQDVDEAFRSVLGG